MIRSIAQTISYEISIAVFFLCRILLFSSLSFHSFIFTGKVWLCVLIPPLFMCWEVSVLAETNRSSFGFTEGEFELVSGFNIEYVVGPFAFIFMAEYTRILVIRALMGAIFTSFSLQ